MLMFDLKDLTHSLGSFIDPEYSIFLHQTTVPTLIPKEEKKYLQQYYCNYV